MSEEEIKNCEFIDKSMTIVNYQDFLNNKLILKIKYDSLKYKRMYKWYIYSNTFMKLYQKDAIWEFLNAPLVEEK